METQNKFKYYEEKDIGRAVYSHEFDKRTFDAVFTKVTTNFSTWVVDDDSFESIIEIMIPDDIKNKNIQALKAHLLDETLHKRAKTDPRVQIALSRAFEIVMKSP